MSRFEIRKRRLGADEQHHHQSACGVVNVDQRRARRRSILKPTMIAAVDLDQFADINRRQPLEILRSRPPGPRHDVL